MAIWLHHFVQTPGAPGVAGCAQIVHRGGQLAIDFQYFVGEARYEGHFPSGQAWEGKARWSQPLASDQRAQLLRQLGLSESTGPSRYWLTEFIDHWPYGKAPGDVYFAPSASQQMLATAAPIAIDPTLMLAVGVMLARPLLRRRS